MGGLLAQRFVRFAEVECRGASPLYERLAQSIAADDELLTLAANAGSGQPAPNLLFAAVHFLLREEPTDPLREFYPSLVTRAKSPGDADRAFRAFCLHRAPAIRALLATRRVQTNEVRRCTYLLPAFGVVAQLAAHRPLALVEVGASAGLNLLWDRYGYCYDGDAWYGNPASKVELRCTLRGDLRPPLPGVFPVIGWRVGVDLHPIDLRDDDAVRWLEALVWPEEEDRASILRAAIEIAREDPPTLVAGDGVRVLPDVLRTIPDDEAVCVFHSHTLNQFSVEARERFESVLADLASTRTIYRLSAEWLGHLLPRLTLTTWRDGQATERLLGHCDHHGRWLEWLDRGAEL
jgi:hypothetical protein